MMTIMERGFGDKSTIEFMRVTTGKVVAASA